MERPDALLEGLVTLEREALRGADQATHRLRDPGARRAILGFVRDHERHVRRLASRLRDLGVIARPERDVDWILTAGKLVFLALRGDRAVLESVRASEHRVLEAYSRALASGFPDEVRQVLSDCLADERRHAAWIDAHPGGAQRASA